MLIQIQLVQLLVGSLVRLLVGKSYHTKQKDGYNRPTNDPTNNRTNWILMSKKIRLKLCLCIFVSRLSTTLQWQQQKTGFFNLFVNFLLQYCAKLLVIVLTESYFFLHSLFFPERFQSFQVVLNSLFYISWEDWIEIPQESVMITGLYSCWLILGIFMRKVFQSLWGQMRSNLEDGLLIMFPCLKHQPSTTAIMCYLSAAFMAHILEWFRSHLFFSGKKRDLYLHFVEDASSNF